MTQEQNHLDVSGDTMELKPEEKAVADALVEWLQKQVEWEEIPPELEETLTPENIDRFLDGDITLAQLLGIDPEEAYGIATLAHSMLEQGNLDHAEGLLEGLVVLNPYDAYFHTMLGTVYVKQGKTEDARLEFDTAIDLDESFIPAYVNRGELLLQSGELEAALEDFRRAIELDPDGQDPMSNRARMLVTLTTMIMNQALATSSASSDASASDAS